MNKEQLLGIITRRVNSTGHNEASIEQFELSAHANTGVSRFSVATDEATTEFITAMRAQGIPDEEIYSTLRNAGMMPEQQQSATGYQHTSDVEAHIQEQSINKLLSEMLVDGWISS